jgi:hypothetical protein
MLAWLGYRVSVQRYGWMRFIGASMLMGIVTVGTTAVTLLPGIEYLRLTARPDLGFSAKGNGFPFQDLAQFILPGSVSLFSPLYVGIPALILVYIAIRDRLPNSLFWFTVAIIGLLHSFGANSAFYHALYNIIPGLSFFRGQERAAFLVANGLAILAGMGAAQITIGTYINKRNTTLRILSVLLVVLGLITIESFIGWQGNFGDGYGFSRLKRIAFFSLIVTVAFYGLLRWQLTSPNRFALTLIAALIVFELFTVNMDAESAYDPIPASQQLNFELPPLVQAMLNDAPQEPYRIDGFGGIDGNYASMYGIMDIRGISPLFLNNAQNIIYRDYTNNPLAWELFAVRYIFSERDTFNSVATTVIAEADENGKHIYLHEIDNPRPFAHLVYHADVVDSDEYAFALLNDIRYQPRESIILLGESGIELLEQAPASYQATITEYEPETFTVEVDTSENAILSLAHVDYPGWQATLDSEPVPILRAYGVLSAVAVPTGEHIIRFTYAPFSYRIGAILSLVTWGLLVILAATIGFRAITRGN